MREIENDFSKVNRSLAHLINEVISLSLSLGSLEEQLVKLGCLALSVSQAGQRTVQVIRKLHFNNCQEIGKLCMSTITVQGATAPTCIHIKS